MNKKLAFVAIIVSVALVITLVIVFLPRETEETLGVRKAFIVCSANDFYGTEEEDNFNNGFDSNFSMDTGRWWKRVGEFVNLSFEGNLRLESGGLPVYTEVVYNWTDYYSLREYAYYNLTAQIRTEVPVIGPGLKVGLEWWNSSNSVVRTDWSNAINDSPPYSEIYIEGICNNDTNNEITQLKLVLAVDGSWPISQNIFFDDVKLSWVTVNLTDPSDPDPPPPARNKNCDGFPAQALHVYKVLKAHGYTDDNIFFMLYWKDDADGVIDIKSDLISNDLVGAVIDVENESVTADRVKQELNVSVAGSFASKIGPNDQLIIYMDDHGSNAVLPDKNATFHFETGGYIRETEFYDLVSKINCKRMMINIDCCFSGNFLNNNSNIGSSWYDLPNCVFVSASANSLSWYWVDNNNGDGFAGSWFFYQFWDQLDQGQTISIAYNYACKFVPAGKKLSVAGIQSPLIQDNLGIINSWKFSSNPTL